MIDDRSEWLEELVVSDLRACEADGQPVQNQSVPSETRARANGDTSN